MATDSVLLETADDPGARRSRPARLPALPDGTLLGRVLSLATVLLWGTYQAYWQIGTARFEVDEPTYVRAGWQYVHGDFGLNREHPPTAKYLFGLAQLIAGGPSITAARVLAATLSLGIGVITFCWLRREIGWWGGLAAAAMQVLLPRYLVLAPPRIDNLALLDPVMMFFAVAGLAAGWRWHRTHRWPWAAASGALLAACVTAKECGAVIVPAIIVLLLAARGRRTLLVALGAFVGAFTVVFVALYAPVGLVSTIDYMIDFQTHHFRTGHAVVLGGHLYRKEPWWSALWYQQRGTGLPVSLVLATGVLVSLIARPTRLVCYLAAGLAGLLTFFLAVTDVVLPLYYFPFLWFETTLTAIAMVRLTRMRPVLLGRVLVAVAVLVLGVASVGVSVDAANERGRGIAAVPDFLAAHGRHGHVLVQKMSQQTWQPYLSGGSSNPTAHHYDAIVIGGDVRFPIDRNVDRFVTDHRDFFHRYRVDDVLVLLPEGQVVDQGGVLSLLGG